MSSAAATALVGPGSSLQEGTRGLLCGVAFGLASPLAGHPLDTLKTMMQTTHTRGSPTSIVLHVVRSEGVLRLYRGLLPPLVGSAVYRSLQFGVYGSTYGALRGEAALCAPDPLLGIQPRVLLAATAATAARAFVETPLENLKVRRQTGQGYGAVLGGATSLPTTFSLRDLPTLVRHAYLGGGLTFARLFVALGSFFVFVDVGERHFPDAMATPFWGAFLKGGVCATAGWALAWPLEYLKNSVQSGVAVEGLPQGAGLRARATAIMRLRGGGVAALYRGMGPGLARSFVANGAAMSAYQLCQSCLR